MAFVVDVGYVIIRTCHLYHPYPSRRKRYPPDWPKGVVHYRCCGGGELEGGGFRPRWYQEAMLKKQRHQWGVNLRSARPSTQVMSMGTATLASLSFSADSWHFKMKSS